MIRLLAPHPGPIDHAQLKLEADALGVNEVDGQVAGYWENPPTQQEWEAIVAAHVPLPPLPTVEDGLVAVARRQARAEILDELIEGDEIDEVAALFPDWSTGNAYAVGDLARFDAVLYRCVQAHTAQPDWSPPVVPALWTPARQTSGPTIDPWVQPTGAQDAYQIGDQVTHNGQTWTSTHANNVWVPGVFGWVTA